MITRICITKLCTQLQQISVRMYEIPLAAEHGLDANDNTAGVDQEELYWDNILDISCKY